MQFTVTVNQSKALEWGLNAQQAMLFAFIYGCPSWANPITTDDGVFYALSKAKIVEELPLLTDKPDTAYRLLRALQDKGLVDLSSTNSITLVRLTDKAKAWNKKEDGSEKYPGEVGKISEVGRKNLRGGSEKSPTNQDTSNQDTSNQDTNQDTSNQKAPRTPKGDSHDEPLPEWLPAEQWGDFLEHRRQLKARMTDRAVKMAIKELGNLRDAGNDPAAVLEQSIVNGWKGVFPVKNRASVHHLDQHRPRPVHHNLEASTDGLTPLADGTYSL